MGDPEADTREHVAQIIADLSRPEAYPGQVDSVTLEETHISLAFLAGDLVYKVKKPVDFGFLDFSTLDKRHHLCGEEVRLNRRLTKDVYHGVVPVTETGGRLRVEGGGPALEYAVKMRRLPDDRILGHLIDIDAAEDDIFVTLSERLARFYSEAATGPGIDEWGTTEAVWRNIEENIQQTQPYTRSIIAPIQLRFIEETSRAFLEQEADLINTRIGQGKIREGHGDLHLQHICVEEPGADGLQILDCVEFNPRLRCGDVAIDIAFLAMDLDYRGEYALATRFVHLMAEQLQDPDLARLVQFFSVYRAHVRNKVACFRTDELAPELPEFFAVRGEAERYIDLATSYIIEPERPTLFLVAGLSGTGKSVISRRLARSIGARLVSSDNVRLELAGREPGQRDAVDYGSDVYTEEFNIRTYETLFDRAQKALIAGQSAVLDATFLDTRWRKRARELVSNTNADLLLLECQCPPEIVHERLARRARELYEPSEANWEIYQEQRSRYGATITDSTELPYMVVQTNRASSQILEEVLAGLSLRNRIV